MTIKTVTIELNNGLSYIINHDSVKLAEIDITRTPYDPFDNRLPKEFITEVTLRLELSVDSMIFNESSPLSLTEGDQRT